MRRAILTIGGTVAAVAALLSFKTHSAAGVSAGGLPAMSGTSSTSGSTSGAASSTGASPAAAAKGGTKGSTKSPSGRTVTGKVANTPDGPTQIQLVLTGKRISQVNVLQHTNNGENSLQIDSFALPKLTSETLAAQSARIDAVSGATYTSQGYIQSLQSAVDAAGLR